MKSYPSIALILLMLLAVLGACARNSHRTSEVDFAQRLMPPGVEEVCNELYAKNQNGKRLSWKTNQAVTFSFDQAFPEEFVPAVERAMATWNEAAGRKLFRVSKTRRSPSLPRNDGQNTFYWLSTDRREHEMRESLASAFAADGGLAATVVSGRSNRITDADVVFDGVNKRFTMNGQPAEAFDVESVALHELGHVLGLKHSEEHDSTMFFGLLPSAPARELDEISIKMLSCEY